jgi:hypothetical protein
MGEFLLPMPRSHSDNLSPLGTDLVKDIAFKTSPSLVPMNNFLNRLFDGHKKIVHPIAWDNRCVCWCGTVELLLVLSSRMVDKTVVIG